MLISDKATIGRNLYQIRKHTGLTQIEVSEQANLSDRTYADIERGSVNMRVDTLIKICEVLHVTPNEILVCDDDDLPIAKESLLEKLNQCSSEHRDVALKLLDVYLSSLNLL